jgi:uncharacterized membrane protein YhaH (DUF805 family)
MLDAIKHGLSGILNFAGRDSRQAFWYYVLFIYILTTAISMVVVLPVTIQSMIAGVQQGIEAGRGQDPVAAQAAVQASMMASMSEMIPAMMWVGVATGIIMLAGLGAAIVRRLHDSDLSGKWALVPAACQLVSIVTVPSQMARMQESMQTTDFSSPMASYTMMQGSFGLGPLLAWVAIGIVIVLGVRKSTPGPNRFGDAPFAV